MAILAFNDSVVNTMQTRRMGLTAQRDPALPPPGGDRVAIPFVGPGTLDRLQILVDTNTLTAGAQYQVLLDGIPTVLTATVPAGTTGQFPQDVPAATTAVGVGPHRVQFEMIAPAGGGLIRASGSVRFQ